MSLSDLELLQLVETAKEKQRGPKGEPGVGIDRIEQYDGESFTIKLTDGNYKKITLQPGRDGEAGEPGPIGPRGEQGADGRAGRAGAAGTSGQDGLPGLPGTSVDTAVVNANGHLLLGFTDGSIIDVGRVVGPAGESGERGPTGLPGQAGQDGTAVLSGPRAPTQDDGVEGDHWIDISSAEFSFFKKSGEGWQLLANLRQPAKNPAVAVPVGGGGGGNGGGGGVDLPPVIININPPANGNNGAPVRAGDLWFDSDQLALYVATKDSSNKIVWVICIPGVTGVPGTQTASVPVIWPVAVDGEEWVNPLTQVTYVFNEPKKQWINVNGGIVSVQGKASHKPVPATPQTGSLWYDTEAEGQRADAVSLYRRRVGACCTADVSLDGINATIDAALIVQSDLLARVGAGESKQKQLDESQGVQDNQINALETQLQLLAHVKAVGSWNYKRNITSSSIRPPSTATFYGTHKDGPTDKVLTNWSDTQLLMIHKTDINGTTFAFNTFEEGDKLEILAKDGSSLCFGTVINNPNQESYGNMNIAVERSQGGPVEDAEYLISVYRPGSNAGDVDLEKLDNRYLVKTDANVVNPNFRIKSDSKVYISTAGGELALNNIKEPTSSHHAATKGYVDSKVGVGIAPPAPLRWIWRQLRQHY